MEASNRPSRRPSLVSNSVDGRQHRAKQTPRSVGRAERKGVGATRGNLVRANRMCGKIHGNCGHRAYSPD